MSDDVTRLDLDGDDAALERALRELGPLMRRQELLDTAEPDAAFARDLRARLVDATDNTNNIESGAPDPAFASGLRERLVGGSPQPVVAPPDTLPAPANDAPAPIPISRPRRRRRPAVWVGLAAAFVAALAVAIALNLPQLRQPHNATTVAGPPLPSLGDITRGYPCPPADGCGGGGGAAGISPIASSILLAQAGPLFYGPLHITAGRLPVGAPALPSYQLGGPISAAQLSGAARRLGIKARVTRVAGQDALWDVAADGSGLPTAKVPLHSLAVSTVTGEMIYHDLRYPISNGRTRAGDRARAIAAAQAWLAQAGWRGARLLSASPLSGLQNAWSVEMNWPGISGATTPGATLTVVPGWRVSEAQLWPLVARRLSVKARGADAALTAVLSGRLPFAVTEVNGRLIPVAVTGGQGTVTHVDVVQVLTADVEGKLYLVPAYRFSGAARLTPAKTPGAHRRTLPISAAWYALVPAG